MIRYAGILILFILSKFFLASEVSASDSYMTSDKIKILEINKTLLFNEHYSDLDTLWERYIKENPDDPLGYLSKIARMMSEMSDREEDLYRDEFRELTDKIEYMVDRSVDSLDNRQKAWYYLFKGHARAYRALYESHFGSMFKAVKLGLSTHTPYEKGLKADSTLYDLYLGLGSYHYWKSARGGILSFFKLLKNEKKKGVEELRLAIDSSVLSSEEAHSALIWIWLEEKNYDSVIAVANHFHEKYPDGKSFLWPLAKAYQKTENTGQAINSYILLRDRYSAVPVNYFNLIEIDYALSEILKNENSSTQLSFVLKEFLSYELLIPGKIRKKQSDKLKDLRKLAKKHFAVKH